MSGEQRPGAWVPDLEARGGVVGRWVAPLGLLHADDECEWADGEPVDTSFLHDPEWCQAQRRCPVVVVRWADGTEPTEATR